MQIGSDSQGLAAEQLLDTRLEHAVLGLVELLKQQIGIGDRIVHLGPDLFEGRIRVFGPDLAAGIVEGRELQRSNHGTIHGIGVEVIGLLGQHVSGSGKDGSSHHVEIAARKVETVEVVVGIKFSKRN